MKRGKKGFLQNALVVLILLALILVLAEFANNPKNTTGTIGIGKVTNALTLSKTEFIPNEGLSGNLKLAFHENDLIPEDSKIYFFFESAACPKYFICNETDSGAVPWCEYNMATGDCNCQSSSQLKKACGITGELPEFDCGDSDLPIESFCCEDNGLLGLGEYYGNLKCTIGGCWGNCQAIKEANLLSLIQYSDSPNSGNYTSGPFRNADSLVEIPGSGDGFGACDNGFYSLLFGKAKGKTGYAAAILPLIPACTETDSGDYPLVGGICTDMNSNYPDTCSQLIANGLEEYNCNEKQLCEKKDYDCEKGCETVEKLGRCKESAQQPNYYDTDADKTHPDGRNYYVRGTCHGSTINTDYCSKTSKKDLIEYYYPIGARDCGVETYSCPYGCDSSQGICSSPVQEPADLTVTNIEKKMDNYLYATVNNIGKGNAGSFTVCAYFLPVMPPIECFDEVPVNNLANGEKVEIQLKNPGVDGKKVEVYADFRRQVSETNENNNKMSVEFPPAVGCSCSDGGFNVEVKGTCTDGIPPDPKEEYCQAGITLGGASDILIEYDCIDEICTPREYNCTENGYEKCEDGRCVAATSTECSDSDGGSSDYYTFGTCTDGSAQGTYDDFCDGNVLNEYGCKGFGFNLVCLPPDQFTCEFGCEAGACIQEERYRCTGWNNVYEIDLTKFESLIAPPSTGNYNLTALFVYDAGSLVPLATTSFVFNVDYYNQQTNPTDTYKGCVNQMCVVVQGSSDDECSNNNDCQYVASSEENPLDCINFIEQNDCENMDCYWYGNKCHEVPEKETEYSAEITKEIAKGLRTVAWWIWLIIGLVLAGILVTLFLTKVIPFPFRKKGKSNLEKDEIQKKYPALIAYVNRAKGKGLLREQTREHLEAKGWPSNLIDKAIKNFW